jgi:Ca2+/H+ antiporter, TMEM165/GDT1 family
MMQVFTQAFLMTFLAEWGDRSQIATVTLSATKDAFGVTLGAILGHSMCTGIAVVGGKFLASRISERTVAIVGGVLFVLFALHSFITGPADV